MIKDLAVHVDSFEQWKDVLNIWFEKGYEWLGIGDDEYREKYFINGAAQLALNINGINDITCFRNNDYTGNNLIEYVDFMAQQEKEMAKETYYVTQEQLDLIEKLKSCLYPLHILVMDDGYKVMNFSFSEKEEKALLRYLGGDTSIEFKVKETLYRLWRIDEEGDTVYMRFNDAGTPIWTDGKNYAFTAPLEEIKKHKTISWEIEKVD